jgi:uncharacterized protein YkwD
MASRRTFTGARRQLFTLIALAGFASANLLFLTAAARRASTANDASRAAQVIAEVNALRAASGLPAYVPDPILMSVAARQNDWRVSTGATTHTGPDGTSPKERAAAAGYGGGATIFISENIVDGTGLTPEQAVQWWTGDAPHLNTMLGPNYVNVGAGAGESGGVWRYTLMAGYIAGGSYPSGQAPHPQANQPPSFQVAPVTTGTPLPDGTLIHVVGPGQTLWTIAAIYGVDLDTLMTMNGLTSASVLHEGDRIIIQPSWTPAPSAVPTESVTATPNATPSPESSAAAPIPSLSPTPTLAPLVSLPRLTPSIRPGSMILIGLGAILVLSGVLLAFRR